MVLRATVALSSFLKLSLVSSRSWFIWKLVSDTSGRKSFENFYRRRFGMVISDQPHPRRWKNFWSQNSIVIAFTFVRASWNWSVILFEVSLCQKNYNARMLCNYFNEWNSQLSAKILYLVYYIIKNVNIELKNQIFEASKDQKLDKSCILEVQ